VSLRIKRQRILTGSSAPILRDNTEREREREGERERERETSISKLREIEMYPTTVYSIEYDAM